MTGKPSYSVATSPPSVCKSSQIPYISRMFQIFQPTLAQMRRQILPAHRSSRTGAQALNGLTPSKYECHKKEIIGKVTGKSYGHHTRHFHLLLELKFMDYRKSTKQMCEKVKLRESWGWSVFRGWSSWDDSMTINIIDIDR